MKLCRLVTKDPCLNCIHWTSMNNMFNMDVLRKKGWTWTMKKLPNQIFKFVPQKSTLKLISTRWLKTATNQIDVRAIVHCFKSNENRICFCSYNQLKVVRMRGVFDIYSSFCVPWVNGVVPLPVYLLRTHKQILDKTTQAFYFD